MTKSFYKMEYPLEIRKAKSARLKKKLLGKILVILEKVNSKTHIPDIDKKRYLVRRHATLGQFVERRRINLKPEQAIFIFVQNLLPPDSAIMSVLYEEYMDEDGFRYMTYSGKNTIGSP